MSKSREKNRHIVCRQEGNAGEDFRAPLSWNVEAEASLGAECWLSPGGLRIVLGKWGFSWSHYSVESRDWLCFQAISDTVFPDTFEQRKGHPLSGTLFRNYHLLRWNPRHPFARTYGDWGWPCSVAQCQALPGDQWEPRALGPTSQPTPHPCPSQGSCETSHISDKPGKRWLLIIEPPMHSSMNNYPLSLLYPKFRPHVQIYMFYIYINPCDTAKVPKDRALTLNGKWQPRKIVVIMVFRNTGKGSFNSSISGRATVLPGKAVPSVYSCTSLKHQHKSADLLCL